MTAGHHDVSPKLVGIMRDLARLPGSAGAADHDARQREALEKERDEEARRNVGTAVRIAREHFELLMDAATSNPDKPRLFLRILEYCRQTGHPGLTDASSWLAAQAGSPERNASRRYFAALAIGSLARLTVDASRAAGDDRLLHRERHAAVRFLRDVLAVSAERFGGDRGKEPFEDAARVVFGVAFHLAALRLRDVVERMRTTIVGGSAASLAADLVDVATRCEDKAIGQLGLGPSTSSKAWRATTGRSLGEWIHWGESITPSGAEPPFWWVSAASALDLDHEPDWNTFRRYPARAGAAELRAVLERLRADDAGWLRDAVAGRPEILAGVDVPAVGLIALVRRSVERTGSALGLNDWVVAMRTKRADDPRRGEWTALEIVRRLITPEPDGPGAQRIALSLHPANVVVPDRWFEDKDGESGLNHLTWESWRRVVDQTSSPVLAEVVVPDYRYVEGADQEGVAEAQAATELTAVGRLLWGLLRLDFAMPPAWNVRGQERALAGALFSDLEDLAISSRTARLLRACMSPRGRENVSFLTGLAAFGVVGVADDMQFDLALRSLQELRDEILDIQRDLRLNQVTVLDHRPRQLVPVRIHEAVRANGTEEGDW